MGLRLSEPGGRGRQRGLAILILALLLGCTEAPKDTVRVLIILDTVRAQSLSACGYERPTSPTLERLVAEGGHPRHSWGHGPLGGGPTAALARLSCKGGKADCGIQKFN